MLYKAGTEVRFLMFNATGTSNINWFSQKQFISSSWTDLKTFHASRFQYFHIYGRRKVKRSFEITKKYEDCKKDSGWLVITSNTSEPYCEWARRNKITSIVYSANTQSANFNNYGKIRHFL